MDEGKREAGRAALREVHSGMRLGLGTGSTVRFFLEALAEALQEGTLSNIVGVPTSEDTTRRALALGIPLAPLHEAIPLALAVDGADEVTPELFLIKGLGGALLREKMVVQGAERFVVIADETKGVGTLGLRSPLPVEVVAFGWEAHLPFFRSLGADPRLRTVGVTPEGPGGEPYRTDNGHLIVDLHFPQGISDPAALDRALQARAGVVETGLFLGLASRAYLAGSEGLRILEAPSPLLPRTTP
jgi:ribose 5-phosphate isomerase A